MKNEFKLNKPINHLAFIMDGNGRWAKARGLERHFGHKKACQIILDIVRNCKEYDIKVVSLYAFSTENWKRPQDEIDHLFDYLKEFFKSELKNLLKEGIKVMISGDYKKLPEDCVEVIEETLEKTKDCKAIILNICLNYGGKEELVRASKMLAKDVKDGKLDIEDITEQEFENRLYTSGLPNVDLLIRTSGEQRTSNYLPWQLAYAEFVFTKTYWPDFNKKELIKCFEEYNKRNRRYGGLDNGKDCAK